MCILDACCYCIFLDIGCMLIAVIILVFRIIVIIAMLKDPLYKDVHFTEDFTAAHATIILAVVGCIIPIFLMWGVCTASPGSVCTFIVLEIIYVIANIVWEIYFIAKHYSKEEHKDYYDIRGSSDYYDYYYDYHVSYYETQDEYKKHRTDDFFWLGPLIFFLVEGYFLWVAYSYYRFLEDEYDDFYEPPIFYA